MTRWYRILAPCPECRRLPAVHLSDWLLEHARAAEPEQPVLNVQCPDRACRDENDKRPIWIVAAHAIVRAELVRDRAA